MLMKRVILLVFILVLILAKTKTKKQKDMVSNGKWSQEDLYYYGMASGVLVSCQGFIAAFALLILQRVVSNATYTIIVQILFAFSCGALLGQTFLHILPEAYSSPFLSDQTVSFTFLAALIFFLLLQRVIERSGSLEPTGPESSENSGVTQATQQKPNIKQKRELEKNKEKEITQPAIRRGSAGFLTLVGSLLHNFIDGAIIGIAFQRGNPKEFIPVTVAVFAHEFPKKMGDMVILLKNNFSTLEAIISSGTINLISIAGVWLGLNSQGLSDIAKQYILVFVGGNFLFIATDIWKHIFVHNNFRLNAIQMGGLLGGILMTVLSML